MRFQVPQFIDIEDKIFGPFTFKQFIYLAGGAGSAYAVWKLLPTFIAVFIALPLLGLALALTFYKVNGKPFVVILQAWFSYTIKSKLFIWKQRAAKREKMQKAPEPKAPPLAGIPRLSESRLSNISWSLDVLDLQQKEKK